MEDPEILDIVNKKIQEDMYGRKSFSSRYPLLQPIILSVRRIINRAKNKVDTSLSVRKSDIFFDSVIARHTSPLFRKLGDSDPSLQYGKVNNLTLAVKALQGIIIEPNETFSFWNNIGPSTAERGYVKGMLISNGRVTEGVGGGLCQLSNLLYWLFLHTSVEIIERHHHSKDIFPDSGRTIPFGTGASVFYNLADLKIKNTTKHPIQLKLWLTQTHLKGQILSTHPTEEKYHVVEKKHNFINTRNGVYRYNEIWRDLLIDGKIIQHQKLMTNCASVTYVPPKIDIHLDK